MINKWNQHCCWSTFIEQCRVLNIVLSPRRWAYPTGTLHRFFEKEYKFGQFRHQRPIYSAGKHIEECEECYSDLHTARNYQGRRYILQTEVCLISMELSWKNVCRIEVTRVDCPHHYYTLICLYEASIALLGLPGCVRRGSANLRSSLRVSNATTKK